MAWSLQEGKEEALASFKRDKRDQGIANEWHQLQQRELRTQFQMEKVERIEIARAILTRNDILRKGRLVA